MNINTNITNRFATTLVTSKVRNIKHEAAHTTFSVILPENAFISQFEMEIKGKVYKAYVKEKEEAKKIYEKVFYDYVIISRSSVWFSRLYHKVKVQDMLN